MLVAAVLAVDYLYQLALPLTGTTTVTVNVANPALEALQLVLLAFVIVWFYVGLNDLCFTRRMSKAIKESRAAEREVEKRIAS